MVFEILPEPFYSGLLEGFITAKNVKVDSLHAPATKFIGQSLSSYTFKITISMSMWNLGRFREKQCFVNNHAQLKFESKNLLSHMWHP